MFQHNSDRRSVRHGFYLHEWRKRKKLTLAQLGAPLGHEAPVISRYEKGERDPGIETIIRLAAVLEIAPGDLFRHPDDPSVDVLLEGVPDDARPHALRAIQGVISAYKA